MKLILSILVALAVAITATAQDIDQIGGQQGTTTTGSGGDVDQLGAGSSNELPELKPPSTTYVPPLWETREGVEAHVRASQCTLSHSVAACNCKPSYRPVRRTTTARKEGTKAMPTPNITINNNMPSNANKTGIVNDPDFGGLIQADPNLAIRSNTSMTYSRNADGGLYYNSTPESGGLLWLWILLGVLGAAALIALLARALGGGNGGGNNHYYNYPQQPQPAPQPVYQPQANPGGAAPAAPFAQPGPAAPGGGHGQPGANVVPGWQMQDVTVLQMVPTGSPAQHNQPKSEPVVVNVHNHYPPAPQPNPQSNRGKKTTTEPAEEKK
jgi:hypothetical protein